MLVLSVTSSKGAVGDFDSRATGNWIDITTWSKRLTGTVTFVNSNTAVVGVGTSFTTELGVGDVLMIQASTGTIRGTVSIITDNTHLTLVAGANGNANGAYSKEATPTSADGVITIQNGHTVTVTADVTADQLTLDPTNGSSGSGLIVNNGVTLTIANGSGTDLTAMRSTVTVDGAIIIDSGAVVAGGGGSSGTTGLLTVNSGGTITLNGTINGQSTVSWPTTVNSGGSILISSTGTFSVGRTGTSFTILNILGTVTVTGGGTIAAANNSNITVGSGGTISLDPGSYVSGNSFILSSDGNIEIGSTAGITSAGATGNVQTTTRSFATGANYTYNGIAAQVTGNGFTGANILTINNSAGVTLSNAATVTTLTIGDVTASSVFNDGGFVITPGGSSVLNLTSGTFNLGSSGTATTWPAFGTQNIASGTTVGYVSSIAQTVSATPAYQNLTLSGSLTKTVGATTVVAGNLSISSAVANLTGNANTANALYLGGAQQTYGTWGSTSSTATYTNDTYFSGTGYVTVSTGCTPPAAPTGIAAQSFCSGASPTVANLAATGTAIQWYAAASGGTALATSTALVNGTHYFATQTVSGCESITRFDVTATVNTTPSAPTGAASQSFCSTASPTVANLTATGTAIQWYAESSGGTALATSIALVDGTHYFATQTVSDCESTTRFDVTATVNDPLSTPGTITRPTNECASSTGNTYSISAVSGAASYTWSVTGTGWSVTAGGSTTTATITIGSVAGTVSVTATNACGTSAASTTGSITPATAPATPGTISGTVTQCPGLANQIYSVTAVTNATSYTWTVPSGWSGTSTTNSITVTTGSAGQNGNITVTANNACGTSSASSLAVTVNAGGTWMGSISTDWNDADNWCGGVPTATIDVTIPSAPVNQPVIGVAGGLSRNITINSGATLTINSSNTLTVSGNWTNSGTFTANSSTVIFNGAAQTVGTGPYNNLTLSVSGTKTFAAATTINGDLSISGTALANLGTYTSYSNTLTLGGYGQSSGSWGGPTSGATHINSTYFATATGILNVNSSSCPGIWFGETSTDWHTTSNWCNGAVPTALTNVVIPSGVNYQPSISASAVCNNITINSGATLTINGSNTLTVSGNWTNSGTFTANSSTVIFNGAAQTVGAGPYSNLTIAGSGTKTISGVTVNGVLSMEGTAAVSAAPTYGGAATLQYNTVTACTAGAEWITPFSATGGVIIASTGTITLNAAKVFNASVPLTINSGATLATNNLQLTFGGDFINSSGTFTAGSSPITIANTAVTQSIAGFTTTGLVSMTKTAGTATFIGNVNGDGLTIYGTGGTLNLGTSLTHIFTGAWTRNAGTLNGGSSLLRIGGSQNNNVGTFNAGTGTIEWYGAAQAIAGVTYYNLTLSGSGTKTMNDVSTVSGNLTMSGTAHATTASNLSIGGNLIIGDGTTFTVAAFTLTVTGTTTVGGGTSGTIAFSLGTNPTKTFVGLVTINTGASWTETAVITPEFRGGITATPTFTGNTGVHSFTTNIQALTGTFSIPGITVTGVTLTNNGTLTCTSTLAGTGGLTNSATGILNIEFTGAVGINTLTATAVGNIVDYGYAGTQTVKAVAYDNLILSVSGTKTFAGATTINGELSISGTAVANLDTYTSSSNTLTLGGTDQPAGSWGGTGSGATYINTTYFAAATGILNVSSSSCTGIWLGVTTDWHTPSNWCDGAVPTASTNLIIPSGGNQPVISAAAVCNNITINSGATLTITGSNTLTVSGNWTNSGTFTANSSTVIFNGADQTVGTGPYHNLTLAGSGTNTTTGVTVNGILSMEGTATASAVPTYGAAATLQYNTATARTAGLEWLNTFAATGGVIIASTGTITLNAAKVFNASVPLNINSGATLATNNLQLTFGGDFINSGGTLTAGSSPIIIANTAVTQSIAGFTTTGLVSMTKTAGTATFIGNVNGDGLTINGSGGTLNLGTGLTHTFTGVWTRTNGTLNGGSSLLKFGGSVSGTGGTFTSGTGTVEWNAAVAQTCAVVTYNNLTLSGLGTKTFGTPPIVNGILSIEGTATVTVTTGVVTYGTNATLQYKTTDTRTVTLEEWITPFDATGGVIIANTAGSITLDVAKVFNASVPLTINIGATLVTNNLQLTFGGDFINSGGTFTAGSSPIDITSTMATQNIAGFTTTGIVSMTKTSGTAIFTGTVNGGALTIISSGGTLNLGTGLTHTISGTLTLGGNGQPSGSWGGIGSGATYINSTYFAAATGILNVATSGCSAGTWIGYTSTDWHTASNWCDGAVPTASTNVAIPSGGNQPVIGAAAVCNNITINSGATLTITGSNTLTVSGNWTNSGTFTANSSTVIFNGAAQTVGTGPYNNLTLSGSGTKTMTGVSTVNGNLTMSGTATTTTAANFTIGGNLSIGDGTTFTAAGFTLTVTGTTTVGGGTSGTLAFSSATNPAKTFVGLVTINTGAGWTETAVITPEFRGGITATPTFTGNTGVHSFTTNTQALTGTFSIPGVTVTGVTLTNNGTLTCTTALAGTGGLTNSATGILNIDFTGVVGINTLTATAVGNIVDYGYAGTQTVKAVAYDNLILSVSGTKTFAAATTITGNLSIIGTAVANLGTYTSSSNTLTLGGNGQILGSWGGTGSGATHINTTYFAAATGILNVSSSSCPGEWIGVTSANWHTTTNWCDGTVPTAFTSVIIQSGVTYQPSISATAVCNNITINSGATLTITGPNTLTVSGNWTNSGTFTANSSTVIFNGAAQTVGTGPYNNLTISGSGTKTISGVTVNGVLSMEGTATVSAAPTYGGSATLQYNTATARTAGTEWITPFAATGGIIIASTGTITLNAAKVFNLSVPLTINNGATLTIGNSQLTFGGDFINNGGTFTAINANIIITNTMAAQSIAGFTTGGAVSMTKTSGTATFQGNVNSGNNLVIDGSGGSLNLGTGLTHTFSALWTMMAGTLNAGSCTLRIGGNSSGTGGTFNAGTGTVDWYGGNQTVAVVTYNNLIFSGSFIKTVSTGTSVQGNLSISGTDNIANLNNGINIPVNSLTLGGFKKISGTWGSTFSSATNQDNNFFTNTTGILTVTTDTRPTPVFSGLTASQSICYGTATVTLSGTVSAAGPVYPANGETIGVTINGNTQNATIAGGAGGFSINFNTAAIPGSGTPYTITYAYAGNVNLTAAANNTSTALTVNLDGYWTGSINTDWNNIGNWCGGIPTSSSDVDIPSTAANQPIIGASGGLCRNITINASASLTISGSNTLTVSGNFTNNGGTFSPGTGTVTFNSASNQAINGTAVNQTFYNVIVNKSSNTLSVSGSTTSLTVNDLTETSGNFTAPATLGINGNLTLTAGTFTAGSTTTIAGNWTNNGGTFTPNSGTINLNGSGSQTTGGTSSTTFNNLTLNNPAGALLAQSQTVNGTLTLTSGTMTVGAYTLTIAGNSPARTSGTINAGNSGATIAFTNSGAITLPASIFTGAVNNMTINGAGGVTASSDFTVNGILYLQSANPSSLKGSLDMGSSSILTMGATATTIGAGDVTGIVKRTTLVAATSYTFGNQFTTTTFSSGGTMPAELSFKISLGTAPSWKTDAILRTYDIVRTGGSGNTITLNLHYLDSELNGNPEADLFFWDYQAGIPEIDAHEKTNGSTIDKWIGISNLNISYFPTVFDDHIWTLSKEIYVVFEGSRGWRMISSPTATNYGDLLSGFITQGATGSTYPLNQPNCLWFDETDTLTTNMSWRTMGNLTNSITPGRGQFFYVFDSVSGAYNDTLPRKMSAGGNANYTSGTFSFGGGNQPVTFSPRAGGQVNTGPGDTLFYDTNISDEGWNLLGNPTYSTLNWDAPTGWTKTNLDNTIYIWDPEANSGNGEYKVWNGTTGSLGDGLIAPYQAFWVHASAAVPGLSFTNSVLTSGGTFYGGGGSVKSQQAGNPSTINLSLNAGGLQSTAIISFMADAKVGPDNRDAYRLEPPSDSWLELFTLSSPSHTMPLVINNLPVDKPDFLDLPLFVGGQQHGQSLDGNYTLHWELPPDWPADWAISLHDNQREKAISMSSNQNYDFEFYSTKSSAATLDSISVPKLPVSIINPVSQKSTLKSTNQLPPFSIIIQKGTLDDDPVYVAPQAKLLQNYPNPFSNSTTLRFSLPLAANVTLEIFDLCGRKLEVVVANRYFEAGIHNMIWYSCGKKPGIYIVRMKTKETNEVIKLIIQT